MSLLEVFQAIAAEMYELIYLCLLDGYSTHSEVPKDLPFTHVLFVNP